MNTSKELTQRKPLENKSNLDFTPKRTQQSWTDQRIEQIKKKYETTNKKSQWPGSQIRPKSILQDKQNHNKITKTQYKEEKSNISVKSPSMDYRMRSQNVSQNYKMATKTNEKDVQSSIRVGNSKANERQMISAFQTSDNFHMKSTLNQKIQIQSAQKFNYKPSMRLATDYCTSGKLRESNPKISKREVNDYRIENIDKINSKIKHLLQCIENCEQEERRLNNASRVELNRSRIDRHSFDRSNISKVEFKNGSNALQLQQTKILQRKSFDYPITYNHAQQNHDIDRNRQEHLRTNEARISRSSSHFEDYLNHYKDQLNERKSRVQIRTAVQNQTHMLRASSCAVKGRRYQLSHDPAGQSYKDNATQIDLQINKFHQKIEQLQQKKRKMNIQFKPFQFECSPIKKISKESQMFNSRMNHKLPFQRLKTQVQRPSSLYYKQYSDTFGAASRKEEKQSICSKAIYRFVKDSIYPQKVTIAQPNSLTPLIPNSKSIIQNSENDQKQSIVIQNIEVSNNKYNNEELRKKIGERMESRKKMLQMIQSKVSQEQQDVLQSQNFIKALCRQVCLDQDLRNSKNWLNQYNNPSKYDLIKKQLDKKRIQMSDEQIESQFLNTNDIENDPFFSFRQEKYTINTVVSSYLDSTRFWQQKLLNCWNIQKILKNQNLSVSLFKNEVSIEDIVRLINTHSGNFYRNRDVYLIFQRIKKHVGSIDQDKISLEQLKQVFGK